MVYLVDNAIRSFHSKINVLVLQFIKLSVSVLYVLKIQSFWNKIRISRRLASNVEDVYFLFFILLEHRIHVRCSLVQGRSLVVVLTLACNVLHREYI